MFSASLTLDISALSLKTYTGFYVFSFYVKLIVKSVVLAYNKMH